MTISLTRLLLLLGLAGLLAWAAFDYQGDQLAAARSELVTAQDDLTAKQTELDAQREAARLTGEMLDQRNQVDHERTEALNDERTKNLALQRAVADRDKRLLVKATCSVPRPADPGAAGVADAGTAELAADARTDYFTLRDELARTREMILGLQDYIRRVVFITPAQP